MGTRASRAGRSGQSSATRSSPRRRSCGACDPRRPRARTPSVRCGASPSFRRLDVPLLRLIAVAAGFAAALAAIVVGAVLGYVSVLVTSIDVPPEPRLAETTRLFDRNGDPLATLHADVNRRAVALERMPDGLIAAVLAAEDKGFFEHGAIDPSAVARAALTNLQAGGVVEGGSTITQQYVKNVYTTGDRTFGRKLREAALAIQLEEELSKREILERYLNTIFLGNGSYGVEGSRAHVLRPARLPAHDRAVGDDRRRDRRADPLRPRATPGAGGAAPELRPRRADRDRLPYERARRAYEGAAPRAPAVDDPDLRVALLLRPRPAVPRGAVRRAPGAHRGSGRDHDRPRLAAGGRERRLLPPAGPRRTTGCARRDRPSDRRDSRARRRPRLLGVEVQPGDAGRSADRGARSRRSRSPPRSAPASRRSRSTPGRARSRSTTSGATTRASPGRSTTTATHPRER